jgi:hypothetical protein
MAAVPNRPATQDEVDQFVALLPKLSTKTVAALLESQALECDRLLRTGATTRAWAPQNNMLMSIRAEVVRRMDA